MLCDAAELAIPDGSYDQALLFFLLHEQPDDIRRATLAEALRVVRPGGKIVIVDYARPATWHPLRLFWLPLLRVLEPFARDLWQHDVTNWLPLSWAPRPMERTTFFGGLYHFVIILR
jgi:ubiquinone/menaquinone biosynthesis C-methylase UbiE